jgi:hypothetical protein
MLKANGYVAQIWVYDIMEAPVFLDGEWNRARRSLGLSPSVSVAYPRTYSLSARISYGDDTYRDNTQGNERRSSYRSSRDHRRSRRSRSPSSGRDYRDRSPARNESSRFVEQIVQGVVEGLLAKAPTRPSPPRSAARHNDIDRRAHTAPSPNRAPDISDQRERPALSSLDRRERPASFGIDAREPPALSSDDTDGRERPALSFFDIDRLEFALASSPIDIDTDRQERPALSPNRVRNSHRRNRAQRQTRRTAGALAPASLNAQQERALLRITDPSATDDEYGELDLGCR